MRYLLAFLPALACVGLMYGCIRMMMPGSHRAAPSETPNLEARVQELEGEIERLRAQSRDAGRRAEV